MRDTQETSHVRRTHCDGAGARKRGARPRRQDPIGQASFPHSLRHSSTLSDPIWPIALSTIHGCRAATTITTEIRRLPQLKATPTRNGAPDITVAAAGKSEHDGYGRNRPLGLSRFRRQGEGGLAGFAEVDPAAKLVLHGDEEGPGA